MNDAACTVFVNLINLAVRMMPICVPGAETQGQGEHSSHIRLSVGHHDIHGIRIPYQPPGLFCVPGHIFLSLLSGAPYFF